MQEGIPSKEVAQVGLARRPRKAVEQSLSAEVQGGWVDGAEGRANAKLPKIAKYVALALHLLGKGAASQRELQVVGGGLVYVAMSPPLWTESYLETDSGLGGPAQRTTSITSLRREVAHEILRSLSLPLVFISMRAPADPLVTVSDASSTGGGVCVSRGLTLYAPAAAVGHVRRDCPEEHDFLQILTIGLFDGIRGRFRVAADGFGVPVAGHISVEKCPGARRAVESYFPDTIIFVKDIELVDAEMVQQWSLRFSNVGLVVLRGWTPLPGGVRFEFGSTGSSSRLSKLFVLPGGRSV